MARISASASVSRRPDRNARLKRAIKAKVLPQLMQRKDVALGPCALGNNLESRIF
jgi:hypothetical protein